MEIVVLQVCTLYVILFFFLFSYPNLGSVELIYTKGFTSEKSVKTHPPTRVPDDGGCKPLAITIFLRF